MIDVKMLVVSDPVELGTLALLTEMAIDIEQENKGFLTVQQKKAIHELRRRLFKLPSVREEFDANKAEANRGANGGGASDVPVEG